MRAVMITGATSGIGRAAVHRFAKEGDHVIAVGRSQTKGMQLLQESDSNGYKGYVDFFQADVANEKEVIQLYKELSMTFSSIDVLVNNVGIVEPAAGSLESISEDEWHKLFNTNVEATLWMMKHGIKHMDRKKGASIINLAATVGVTTHPPALAAYSASKAALVSLTKSLACRYAKQGIRINAISPELVDTPLAHWLYGGKKAFKCANSKHPRGIGAAPDEIASIIYFLASKDASYIIGHNLIADGGLSLK
jgi:3-oxoacyl-[acyl-carrier protein] reductase